MKIIGLTGGIGSGKSTVAQFLAELGAVILDADKIGHETLKQQEVRRQIVEAFGKQIISEGEIDREKLGKIVFSNPEARTKLNRIIHPPMYDTAKARLEQYRQQGAKVAVIDAPLLIEVGWTSLVDEVWVTTAPEATVLKRLKERTGLSEQESAARIRSQLTLEERKKHADIVIDTGCDLDELKAKVKELWRSLSGIKQAHE